MKEYNSKKYLKKHLLTALIVVFMSSLSAQTVHIGSGVVWYLSAGTHFTTSGNVITIESGGVFAIEAGTTWDTATEYVDGAITVVGAGTSISNVGADGTQSTITLTTFAGDEILTDYFKTAPSGTMDNSLSAYGLSNSEYWKVTKIAGPSSDVSVTNLTNTATKYGPDEDPDGTAILVRRDDNSSNWVDYSSNPGFGEFTYAAPLASLNLGIDEMANFLLYPNPIRSDASSIKFSLPSGIQNVNITLYDITGKIIKQYTKVSITEGINTISKPKLAKGVYLLRFSFNNDSRKNTKRLLVN